MKKLIHNDITEEILSHPDTQLQLIIHERMTRKYKKDGLDAPLN